MVKFIAHRGNLNGPQPEFENTDEYLKHAYHSGHDVECDLIVYRGTMYYGHDEPQTPADLAFLQQVGVWSHAKNLQALEQLLNLRTNCFWHETDKLTLTSAGYIWCYPNTLFEHKKAVWLDLHDAVLPDQLPNIYGICGDYDLNGSL